LTSFFPRSVIDVFVEVLQADAGTRTAGINAEAVALADAGIPMKRMISSCAAGKVADNIVLDPMKEEDNFGQADLPIAMTPNGDITLMQMDGGLTPDEFRQAVEMAMKGARDIYEIQRQALVNRYSQLTEPALDEVHVQ
ncbi:MAG: exosome complex component, partial [Euryarchaeota archaeon]|nr:exosome complex component [Euryarchaeota archaeon]